MSKMTPATRVKRQALLAFIDRVLKPHPAVQAVIGIGSIASGRMRPDSDIDAIVLFDPLDWYIIPAEFIWRPSDGTFHSIFTRADWVKEEGIEFDFLRMDIRQWTNPAFVWPEPRRAEWLNGWIAFDRTGEIQELIVKRTAYSDKVRLARLDGAIIWLDQHLAEGKPSVVWDTLGPAIAHDRLQAAYDQLVKGLFAYNCCWLPWRDRQMEQLLALPWLPKNFEERVLAAANVTGLDYDSYLARAIELHSLFEDLLNRLVCEGYYLSSPIEEAFKRTCNEPGFAWNMDEWRAVSLRRDLLASGRE